MFLVLAAEIICAILAGIFEEKVFYTSLSQDICTKDSRNEINTVDLTVYVSSTLKIYVVVSADWRSYRNKDVTSG